MPGVRDSTDHVTEQANGDIDSNKNPFSIQWLDSCYQTTLLPNGPWHQLEEKIALSLTERVERQFNKDDRREMLLHLLGTQFVQKYLPNCQTQPSILEPPDMSYEERAQLKVEAQSWLNSQLYKSVREVGYGSILSGAPKGDNVPPDLSEFYHHTFDVFYQGLDRELFLQEQQLTKEKKEELEATKHRKRSLDIFRLPAPSRSKPATAISSTLTVVSSKPSTGYIKTNLNKLDGDPPPLWGPQSDALGQSIVSILKHDPRKFDKITTRLHGRQLPGSLRLYIWADVLYRSERKKMAEVNVEKLVRERFAKSVYRGMGELKIKQAMQSPISRLIENTVIESYSKTVGLVPYKEPPHLKEAARTLNVLYVYDRSYEPYLVYWLFPLQVAFRPDSDIGEHIYELAMYLDLLNTTCFPTWPEVFGIAEKVMSTLQLSDPELFDHLKTIAMINVEINPKEFLIQLIHEEKAKAESLLKATPGSIRSANMSAELLADPLIFLRKWVGEGFVSILDSPAVLYIWDQCFMQGWRHSVLQNTCLAIVELLRHKFMAAKDYRDMKQVFFNEPCKLYTVDVQMAWIHLENGKDLNDVPYLNRQRTGLGSPSPRPTPLPTVRSLVPSPFPVKNLQPCGIKELRLKLVIPPDSLRRNPWLQNLDMNCLKLHVAVYFGSIRVRSRGSIVTALLKSSKKDNYGSTVYYVEYPDDRFVFDRLDLSQYDVEKELGAYPYTIIQLEYSRRDVPRGTTPVKLGWSRIQLFQRPNVGDRPASAISLAWILMGGEYSYTLHPGQVPEGWLATRANSPTEQVTDFLGYHSELMATVYDPRNEAAPSNTLRPIPRVEVTPDLQPATPYLTPPPQRTVQTPPVPSPPRPSDRSPKPPPPSPPDDLPWIEHDPETKARDPSPTNHNKAFDLYVDAVKNIPDSASIVKVTGRVLKTGVVTDLPDILAMPTLSSSGRSPRFDYRLAINTDEGDLDTGAMVLLRVYSVDIITETLVVIGSCLLALFDVASGGKGQLRVGGHQYRLHSGIPDLKLGIQGLKATDLDTIPVVPGVSLLIRLLPSTEDFVPAPKYSSGYYRSEACRPSVSEIRIFNSYKEHMAYPATVRDMIWRVQQSERKERSISDEDLLSWLQDRLDVKNNLPSNEAAPNLSLRHCIRYRIKTGLNVKINQAFGLPDGLYIQCFSRVAPGRGVLGMPVTEEGHGKTVTFITLKHDYTSLKRSPKWKDEPKELHPFYDDNSVLLVQFFGLKVVYTPKSDHSEAGQVQSLTGGDLSLSDDDILGWTAVPMFSRNAVLSGTHYVAIFKGKPSEEILESLAENSLETILKQKTWNATDKFEAASLSVTLWDGHFELNEHPEMPIQNSLIEAVGKLDIYKKVWTLKTGKKMADIIVDGLETKYKKQGMNSAIYQKEEEFFDKVMGDTFYDLIETQLMNAGYGPL